MVLSNIRDTHSVSVMASQIIEATARLVKDDTSLNVKFTNQPFPIISTVKARKNSANGSTVAMMFVIAFAIIPASIVRELVIERRSAVYHQ